MKQITYITGNAFKFRTAKKALEGLDFELVQKDLDAPEIQSADVDEIAKATARWVSEKLNEPIILTDAGYYITALNGFPGPFIKFVNKWLTADDFLRLMNGKENRDVVVIERLAYSEPGKEPVTFEGKLSGRIALKKGVEVGTAINQVFVPQGFEVVESEIDQDSMTKFWAGFEHWSQLVHYLKIND